MRIIAPILGLILTAPAAFTADVVTPIVVPFELLTSRHMAVQVMINDEGPYRMVFDTGAPTVLVSTRVAKAANLRERSSKPAPKGVKVTPGQLRIDALEMGPLKAEHVSAVAMDHPTVVAMSKYVGPLDGIVGFPVFARYRTTIDYQAKQLTFTPNGYQPADIFLTVMQSMAGRSRAAVIAPAATWGVDVAKSDDDAEAGVTVRAVAAGSAADAAGLRAGDRLLTIDGRWTDSVEDCYRAAAAVPPNRAVPVALRRDDRALSVTVKPRLGL